MQAEAHLLGAAMLVDTAAQVVAQEMSPEDFYGTANGHIAHAIVNLVSEAAHVDAGTVAAQLRKDGLLDVVGGPGELMAIVAGCPATGGAAKYAEIVTEAAQRRRVLRLTAEIADAVYGGMDAGGLIGELSAVRQSGLGVEFEDVGAVLRGEVDQITPTMLRRSDGAHMLYPALLHWLMGEPGKGKTMVAIHLAAEQILEGNAVLYLDWEGNRRIVGGRLQAMGVDAKVVDEHLLYWRPRPLTHALTASLAAAVEAHGVTVAIFDGFAKAMARQNLDEDKAPQVLGFLELAVDPILDAGAAVLCLDHVAKDKDSRGLWPRGSGAKQGEVSGAAWYVRPKRGFSRHKAGEVSLIQAKDREGFLGEDGSVVARVTFSPKDGGALDVAVMAPEEGGEFRPTGYMERVSRTLEAHEGPATLREIRTLTHGKNDVLDAAIQCLVSEGYIAIAAGPRGSKCHSSIKPFREQETTEQQEENEWF